ncbi:hypothetical protein, partial [Nonomuraea sp. NPDC049028]|uniref:hypothetical protein n=1 Tax=Nonomuraea sp. NPDC049028 TaxID=3364348 RepID=UPI0037210F1F
MTNDGPTSGYVSRLQRLVSSIAVNLVMNRAWCLPPHSMIGVARQGWPVLRILAGQSPTLHMALSRQRVHGSESALRELMPLSSLRLDEFCGSAIHRSAYGRG